MIYQKKKIIILIINKYTINFIKNKIFGRGNIFVHYHYRFPNNYILKYPWYTKKRKWFSNIKNNGILIDLITHEGGMKFPFPFNII